MEKAKLGLIVVISFFLLVSAKAYGITESSSAETKNDDVILEKLNTIQIRVTDLKNSFDNMVIKKDSEIKEINSSIVELRLAQGSQETKISIIWGIFVAITGGGGIAGGVAIQKKRNSNGKANVNKNGN